MGGIPSALTLRPSELNESIRSIAHLVPGNSKVKSQKGRWVLGAVTHMGISISFATLYSCRIRRRPLLFALALWVVNIKVLAPDEMRRQDRSKTLADHLMWGAAVGAVISLQRTSEATQSYA